MILCKESNLGRVEVRKKEALRKVEEWDGLEVMRPLSFREKGLKLEAMEEFKHWALLEETSWRQKSRGIWLKEGDRNTGFFYRMANSHRRGNQIHKMRINGVWVTKETELRQGIVQAFKTVLTDIGEWRTSLDGLSFPKLKEAEAPRLEMPFPKEEVF